MRTASEREISRFIQSLSAVGKAAYRQLEAAARLLAYWSAGDTNGARTIAEQDAIDVLFAIPVASPENRGCNQGSEGPRYCVYRINDVEVQFKMDQLAEYGTGWVVTQIVRD